VTAAPDPGSAIAVKATAAVRGEVRPATGRLCGEGWLVAVEQTLRMTTAPGPGLQHAAVAGEIDIATAGDLQAFLARCLCAARGSCGLVVDLSAVTFIDASGLRVLLLLRSLAADLAVRFRIAAPAPCVDRLLAITGLQGHFPVTDDRAAQVLLPATPARSELFSAG
jgi:anti-sigma B factor antagonist